MYMPKISVIVPVYNVELYLQRCVDSILNQTFVDFELILIDDGSADNSGIICDDYEKKDHRVKVLHTSNNGVSRARNLGLNASTGEYISFVDSDDYVQADYLQVLYDNMVSNDFDCVSIGCIKVNNEGKSIEKLIYNVQTNNLYGIQDKYKYITDIVLLGKTGWELWSRLFKSSIIKTNNIKICEFCDDFAEDLAFLLVYIMHCISIRSIDYAGYFYSQRDNSMTGISNKRIKLNSMNEVAYYFWQHLCFLDNSDYILKYFPIVHFLTIYNQLIKLYFSGDLGELLDESNRILKKQWYNKMVMKSIFFRKSIIKLLGESRAKWCLSIYYYSVYKNKKIFLLRELITEKIQRIGNKHA